MASNDEILKREIIDKVGINVGPYEARIFIEGSNFDQVLFEKGGLTFKHEGLVYGSNDCVYVKKGKKRKDLPVMAIEATNALDTGSSGNAQYQRFHHALGAVRNGIIGILYLKPGKHRPQPDLYGVTIAMSEMYGTPYIIVHDLRVVKKILDLMSENEQQMNTYIKKVQEKNYEIFKEKFFGKGKGKYEGSWEKFADQRSTIIFDDSIVKYNMTSKRNLTEGSQRAGHIAVGEMLLTQSYFPAKHLFYLWPRMTRNELDQLRKSLKKDKEFLLMDQATEVSIKTLDDLINIPADLKETFLWLRDKSLTTPYLKPKNKAVKELHKLIKSGEVTIKT